MSESNEWGAAELDGQVEGSRSDGPLLQEYAGENQAEFGEGKEGAAVIGVFIHPRAACKTKDGRNGRRMRGRARCVRGWSTRGWKALCRCSRCLISRGAIVHVCFVGLHPGCMGIAGAKTLITQSLSASMRDCRNRVCRNTLLQSTVLRNGVRGCCALLAGSHQRRAKWWEQYASRPPMRARLARCSAHKLL